MNDALSKVDRVKLGIRGGLIVSCQAPAGSPLSSPSIIAAFAETAEQNGAAGVRIDTPDNIAAVRSATTIPIFGIYKIISPGSDVYITPTFDAARTVASAGADVIAIDATGRIRLNDESIATIRERIRSELDLPAMADVATFDEGLRAAEDLGFDFVSTTLSGYTSETNGNLSRPDFTLIEQLSGKISVPVIAEGRLRSPDDVRRAFDCGAFAVVVGNAITGIDSLVRDFVAAGQKNLIQPTRIKSNDTFSTRKS